MILATWNVNHRVGRTRFRVEAAEAAAALRADILVLTEYCPPDHDSHDKFLHVLAESGLVNHAIQPLPAEAANRVLVASRWAITDDDLVLPTFDLQFPANITPVRIPTFDLCVLGVRVPYYERDELPLVVRSWNWLEDTAASRKGSRAVIVGDLNVHFSSRPSRGRKHFERMLERGWARANPTEGASYYGRHGCSEIDHVLGLPGELVGRARYVTEAGGFKLTGPAGTPSLLSDHAALVAEIVVDASEDGGAT